MPFKSVIFAGTMSVSRVFLMFMSLCVGFASCVKDPDPSLHSAPEILGTTMSVDGADVKLRCNVSRSDNINDCGFYFGLSEENMARYGSDLPADGEFSTVIHGLTYGVRYCFRSFISGGEDTRMSEIQRVEIDQRKPSPSIMSLNVKDGTTVVCEYSVADIFSGEMIICGLCWSTSSSPTISLDTKTLDGTEYGSHTVSVEGLTVGDTYYFRAYAVNGKGTAYSDEVSVEIMLPFEDKEFADWMAANWDRNSDGKISVGEAALVTKIDIASDYVHSLRGIEYMPDLDTLRCRGLSYGKDGGSGGLSDVDLKANVNLTCLDLSNNRIESLDLSPLERLTSLGIGGNVDMVPDVLDAGQPFVQELISLDISGCRNLGPDLSMFTSLEELHYDSNTGIADVNMMFRQKRGLRRLYTADALKDEDKIYLLSGLELLDCSGSSVRTLALAYNPALKSLNVDGCDQMALLDLSANQGVTELRCMSKGLARLELLEGQEIEGINVNLDQHRYISESVEIACVPRIEDKVFKRFLLDNYDFDNDSYVSLAEASGVVSMNIQSEEYSGIASLYGIGMFPALERLDVSGQPLLTELDLSKNAALTVLVCDNTSLKALDLSDCPALVSLYAQNTSLESLDLSRNPALKEAYLSGSPIKTLYLTAAQKATLRLICDPDTQVVIVD